MHSWLLKKLAALALTASAAAQPSGVQPAEPRRADPLVITYNSGDPKAHLKAPDDITAILWVQTADGSHSTRAVPLKRDGDVCRVEWSLPPEAIGITVHFISLNPERAYDPGAQRVVIVRDAAGSFPRGSGVLRVQEAESWEQTRSIVDEERSRFPDSLAILREKWFRAGFFIQDEAEQRRVVEADLPVVEAAAHGHPENPEATYALAAAYERLGRMEDAFPLAERLVRDQPQSHYAGAILSHLDYHVYSMPKGTEKDRGAARSRELLLMLAQSNPRADFVRWQLVGVIAPDQEAPLALIDHVADAWLKDLPGEPQALMARAGARLARNTDLEAAQADAARAADELVRGTGRLHGDISGQLQAILTADAYLLQARVAVARSRFAEAIPAALAAQVSGSSTEASDACAVEGRSWEELGDLRRAERAFAKGLLLGNADAEESLRRLHVRRTRSDSGFGDHLRELLARATSGDRRKAPPFKGATLDGAPVAQEDLKGKIVVINFWHTHCAPCIAEIPQLNRLTESRAGADIAFLGVTFDDASALRPFLEKRAFAYTIVPDAASVARAFGVIAYPTHIIVDQQGRIAFTAIGGSETIGDKLGGVIDALRR